MAQKEAKSTERAVWLWQLTLALVLGVVSIAVSAGYWASRKGVQFTEPTLEMYYIALAASLAVAFISYFLEGQIELIVERMAKAPGKSTGRFHGSGGKLVFLITLASSFLFLSGSSSPLLARFDVPATFADVLESDKLQGAIGERSPDFDRVISLHGQPAPWIDGAGAYLPDIVVPTENDEALRYLDDLIAELDKRRFDSMTQLRTGIDGLVLAADRINQGVVNNLASSRVADSNIRKVPRVVEDQGVVASQGALVTKLTRELEGLRAQRARAKQQYMDYLEIMKREGQSREATVAQALTDIGFRRPAPARSDDHAKYLKDEEERLQDAEQSLKGIVSREEEKLKLLKGAPVTPLDPVHEPPKSQSAAVTAVQAYERLKIKRISTKRGDSLALAAVRQSASELRRRLFSLKESGRLGSRPNTPDEEASFNVGLVLDAPVRGSQAARVDWSMPITVRARLGENDAEWVDVIAIPLNQNAFGTFVGKETVITLYVPLGTMDNAGKFRGLGARENSTSKDSPYIFAFERLSSVAKIFEVKRKDLASDRSDKLKLVVPTINKEAKFPKFSVLFSMLKERVVSGGDANAPASGKR